MMQYIIIGNFGNHSLAAMQALIEKDLATLHFIYVDTGWAAASWPKRIEACSNYARSQNVVVHPLQAQASFAEMVIDRKQFPSRKFQWCASFLKGLAIIKYLDELDPTCEALIILGKRQQDSRRYANLSEFEFENELYQGRTLWHPLWQTSHDEWVALIKRAGFSPLQHQSLECSPCIHAQKRELSLLDSQSIARLTALEQHTGQSLFQDPIEQLIAIPGASAGQDGLHLQLFDFGCGAPWGCGE